MFRPYCVAAAAAAYQLVITCFFQLPGVEACDRYSFRYGRNPLVVLPLVFNPAGSARAQPKTSSPQTALVIR